MLTTYHLPFNGKELWVNHFGYIDKKTNYWTIDILVGNDYSSLSEADLAFAVKAMKDAKCGELHGERH